MESERTPDECNAKKNRGEAGHHQNQHEQRFENVIDYGADWRPFTRGQCGLEFEGKSAVRAAAEPLVREKHDFPVALRADGSPGSHSFAADSSI
jgi:hypothetical protein